MTLLTNWVFVGDRGLEGSQLKSPWIWTNPTVASVLRSVTSVLRRRQGQRQGRESLKETKDVPTGPGVRNTHAGRE